MNNFINTLTLSKNAKTSCTQTNVLTDAILVPNAAMKKIPATFRLLGEIW